MRTAQWLKAIGEHVRKLREARGDTQAQLADRAGVNVKAVVRVEGGMANYEIDSLLRVFEALEVKPAWLSNLLTKDPNAKYYRMLSEVLAEAPDISGEAIIQNVEAFHRAYVKHKPPRT